MSTGMAIDPDSLMKDRNTVERELTQIERELSLLQEDIGKLDRSWDGPAEEAFRVRMREDIEGAYSVCAYLREYVACMDRAHAVYLDAEKQIEETVSKISIGGAGGVHS